MSEHDQAILDLGAKLAADPYEALPRAVVKMQWFWTNEIALIIMYDH